MKKRLQAESRRYGARDLSHRNVSRAQTRPQDSKVSFVNLHPCGLKSALRSAASTQLWMHGSRRKGVFL